MQSISTPTLRDSCASASQALKPNTAPIRPRGSAADRHQAATFFAASDDPEDGEMKGPWLILAGFLMTVAQCLVTAGLFAGVSNRTCVHGDQCDSGQFCKVTEGRCSFCGSNVPMLGQANVAGDVFNAYRDARFVGYNLSLVGEVCSQPTKREGLSGSGLVTTYQASDVSSWCTTCIHPIDGSVDPLTSPSRTAANVGAMLLADHVALMFAAFIIAFKVVEELKVNSC